MATIREVLYQHTKKNSSRSIARAFNISNTTVKKYGLIKIWIDSIFYHCIIQCVNYKRWLCLKLLKIKSVAILSTLFMGGCLSC